MRVLLFVIRSAAITTFLYLSALAQTSNPADWTMHQGNALHTGNYPNIQLQVPLELKWLKEFPSDVGRVYQTSTHGELVIASCSYPAEPTWMNQLDYEVVCLNAYTGEQLWRQEFVKTNDACQAVVGDGRVFVYTNPDFYGVIEAFDLATGSQLWRNSWTSQFHPVLAPTYVDGSLYLDGAFYGGMRSFDAATGDQLWFTAMPDFWAWSPAVYGDEVFTFVGTAYSSLWFQVWERSSGAFKWQIKVERPEVGATTAVYRILTSPVVDTMTRSVIVTIDQWQGAVDLDGHTYRWLTSGAYGNFYYGATPAVSDGLVYSVNAGQLVVLDILSGNPQWVFRPEDSLDSLMYSPLIAGDYVAVSSHWHTYILDRNTHELKQKLEYGGNLSVGPHGFYVGYPWGKLAAYGGITTDVADQPNDILPSDLTLTNYPNPFNASTVINYSLPTTGRVQIDIFNSLGQRVRRLLNSDESTGDHSITWNGQDALGNDLASGSYLCRVKTADATATRKLLLLR